MNLPKLPGRIDAATLPEFVKYLHNRTIGLEDLYDGWASGARLNTSGNYPPYNLVRTSDDTYELVMAVAGFKKDEVQVIVHDRELLVEGKKKDIATAEGDIYDVISQGIAFRDWYRSFKLAEYMVVRGAKMEDGMLTISLEREIPDAAKAQIVEIK
jgi:molecular chaperone IbpA